MNKFLNWLKKQNFFVKLIILILCAIPFISIYFAYKYFFPNNERLGNPKDLAKADKNDSGTQKLPKSEKLDKVIDALYSKLNVNKSETELLKYESKLETMANAPDDRALNNENNFIRKKIDEIKSEINQLENNLLFFSNVEEDNPVVKDVYKNINKHKKELSVWKSKLKKIKRYYS